ncbi:MAG: hypothetical protein IKF91_02400 [Bacilli bacterium]|nr:hypothetical protein [Bacilli bacterium]
MNEDLPIFEISYNDYNDLLIKSAKDIDVEHFLFLSKYQNTYLAIDNEVGAFQCEEFPSKEKALCWLLRKDYSAEEIMKLQAIEARHLIQKVRYKIIPKGALYGI